MTTGTEKPQEMSKVEKLARLVRRIPLTIIWLGAIAFLIALAGGFADEIATPK